MSLPTKTIQAILKSQSAQPEEVAEMALELLNRRHLDGTDVDIRKVPVCLQPVQTDVGEPYIYGCRILDDRTGEERAFAGWYETVQDAVDDARLMLDGEVEVGCDDLLVLT